MKIRNILFIFFTTFKNGEASNDDVKWLRTSVNKWVNEVWDKFISSD